MKELKPQIKSSFARKVIRALGREGGFGIPLPSREKKLAGASAYYLPHDAHKELTNALLEAEKSKAEGIMGYKKRDLPH